MRPATTFAAIARRVIDWRGRHGDDLAGAFATRFLRYRQPLVTGSPPWFDKERNKISSRGRKAASLAAAHGGKLLVMQNLKLPPSSLPPICSKDLPGLALLT